MTSSDLQLLDIGHHMLVLSSKVAMLQSIRAWRKKQNKTKTRARQGYLYLPQFRLLVAAYVMYTSFVIPLCSKSRAQRISIRCSVRQSGIKPRRTGAPRFAPPSNFLYVLEHGATGVRSRQRKIIFPVASVSRPALRPTQLPIQWVPVVLSRGKERPGRNADLSHPSSAKVKNK
jgi:hypothetical protein